jgi:hypothetical protein
LTGSGRPQASNDRRRAEHKERGEGEKRWLTDARARMGFYANFRPEVQTTVRERKEGIYK